MISSVTDLTSIDHPELELYRTLRRSREHRKRGLFVVEGNKVVERFLASGSKVVSILLTDEWLAECSDILERRPEPVAVYRAPGHLFRSIVGFNYHQGILAVGRVPPPVSLRELCSRTTGVPRLFVALDDLSSSENTGVIIRNCAACGANAIISGPASSDPYLRRSVRNSMGNIFNLPIHFSTRLDETLDCLRNNYGFTMIAAHLGEKSISMHEVNFTGDCCIVLGNEQYGVSEEVLRQCTAVTSIPMHSGVSSFNVACASAILLYEAFRQRNGAKNAL